MIEGNETKTVEENQGLVAPKKVRVRKIQFNKSDILLCVIIILLLVNIGVGLKKPQGTIRSAQTQLKEMQLLDEYTKNLGKQCIQVVEEKVVTNSYGTKRLSVTMKNKSNKDLNSVYVYYDFYKNGEFLRTESAWTSTLKAGQTYTTEAYLPDDFDEYSISSMSARPAQ